MKKRQAREKRGLTFMIHGLFVLFVLIGFLSLPAVNGNAQTEIPEKSRTSQLTQEAVEAEPFLRQAINIRIQQLGSESPEVAESLNDLGEWYALQEKNTEAELLYQRALEILDATAESEEFAVVTALENLITLYKKIGKEDRATTFEERLSKIHTGN